METGSEVQEHLEVEELTREYGRGRMGFQLRVISVREQGINVSVSVNVYSLIGKYLQYYLFHRCTRLTKLSLITLFILKVVYNEFECLLL